VSDVQGTLRRGELKADAMKIHAAFVYLQQSSPFYADTQVDAGYDYEAAVIAMLAEEAMMITDRESKKLADRAVAVSVDKAMREGADVAEAQEDGGVVFEGAVAVNADVTLDSEQCWHKFATLQLQLATGGLQKIAFATGRFS